MSDTNNTTIRVQITPGPGTYTAHLGAIMDRNLKSTRELAREIAEAHDSAQYRVASYWLQFPRTVLCVVHADIYGWVQS